MSQSHTLHVLVAEDEESFLRVLTTTLESTKRFTVYACEDGAEAIQVLKRAQFDVVILDYKMPEMTGLNVLQWLHEQKSDTPVIVLTGAGSENIAVEAMKLGAYDYITKDMFDRNHFPLVVEGVYERYLFRKEKKRSEEAVLNRERELASLELLSNAAASFARHVNDTHRVITRLTDDCGEMLLAPATPTSNERYRNLIAKIRGEIKNLEYSVTSIVELSKAMEDSYRRIRNAERYTKKVPSKPEPVKDKEMS